MTCEFNRVNELNSRIKALLLNYMPVSCIYETNIKGFNLLRKDEFYKRENCFEMPLVGLVIQGEKCSFMCGREYTYGENQCIIAGVDIPISSYVLSSSSDKPFLFMYLYLDREMLSSLAYEMNGNLPVYADADAGISITDANADLLEMFLRLLELNEKPEQIPIRAPMMLRELHYLLLIGAHGRVLRSFYTPNSKNFQVLKAINWIRENFKKPMRVEFLAQHAGMSVASLHRHFKTFTGLSPLQYQKQLRLFEAQRLMYMEHERASSAALAVGYESAAQFNREYKKVFGNPPLMDMKLKRSDKK